MSAFKRLIKTSSLLGHTSKQSNHEKICTQKYIGGFEKN